MKTENLTKAAHSAEFLVSELRAAHSDAVASGNEFAEVAIFAALDEAVKIRQHVLRLAEAAGIKP